MHRSVWLQSRTLGHVDRDEGNRLATVFFLLSGEEAHNTSSLEMCFNAGIIVIIIIISLVYYSAVQIDVFLEHIITFTY